MSNKESDKIITDLKKALAATTKAISKNDKLKINFSNSNISNRKEINLSPITKKLSKKEILINRGIGDLNALEKRLTNQKTLIKYEPKGTLASEIYKKMEETRCAILGEVNLPGTATNINAKI